jgi:predicted HTH domain antitoxin
MHLVYFDRLVCDTPQKINSEFSKKIHVDLFQRILNLEQQFGKDSLDYNSQIESLKILNVKLEDENRRFKNENKVFEKTEN